MMKEKTEDGTLNFAGVKSATKVNKQLSDLVGRLVVVESKGKNDRIQDSKFYVGYFKEIDKYEGTYDKTFWIKVGKSGCTKSCKLCNDSIIVYQSNKPDRCYALIKSFSDIRIALLKNRKKPSQLNNFYTVSYDINSNSDVFHKFKNKFIIVQAKDAIEAAYLVYKKTTLSCFQFLEVFFEQPEIEFIS